MPPHDVIAIVGACAPERQRYARTWAITTQHTLVPAASFEHEADPVRAAVTLAALADTSPGAASGIVIELPALAPTSAVIAACSEQEQALRLTGVICVVDAAHLLRDLSTDEFVVSARDALGAPSDEVARASRTVTQIEFASAIVVVNWENLPTPELSTHLALLSALAPHARIRLDSGGAETSAFPRSLAPYNFTHDRAGWISILNDAARPHMTDIRVSRFRYEQLRPFHPDRLAALLMQRFDTGEFGQVVRSAGFCRFASRPHTVLQWDQVGPTIAFHIVADHDDAAREGEAASEYMTELGSTGQDLAFIGLDLDHAALSTALHEAALTDAELAAGPDAWVTYVDPFPANEPAGRHE